MAIATAGAKQHHKTSKQKRGIVQTAHARGEEGRKHCWGGGGHPKE